MTPQKTAKLFYAYVLAMLFVALFSPTEPWSGNLLYDLFWYPLTGIYVIDLIISIINLTVFVAAAIFIYKSDGISKSHFKNIFLANAFLYFVFLLSYSELLKMDTDANYFSFSVFVALICSLYGVWRFIRGAYLCFNDREIGKMFGMF